MNLPSYVQYILFDLDGTLVNTEPVGPETFVRQLQKHGVSPSEEEQALFTKIWRRDGTDIKQDDWLPEVAQKYGITITPDEYMQEFYAMYVNAILDAPPLPGADDCLRQAKTQYKTALVTASKRHQVEAILARHGWRDLFDTVVTADDFTRHKPDPEPFQNAIERLGAKPEQCAVVEDSKNGVRAGKAAGCYVIGVRADNENPQALQTADEIIPTLQALLPQA